jgi:hypothetical protein
MRTIKIDKATYDISTSGKLVDVATNAEAWAQYLVQRLMLWKGEYFLNTGRGVPYIDILGSKKDPDQKVFIDVIENAGRGTVVTSFTMERTPQRRLKITFTCNSEYGEINSGVLL